jgi:hypothetical protein
MRTNSENVIRSFFAVCMIFASNDAENLTPVTLSFFVLARFMGCMLYKCSTVVKQNLSCMEIIFRRTNEA